ncbi:MAG: hypothetical protein PHT69_04450 [Bacteroidales bacterium]|nr:hypothetical protein [Bacteroidales bacterium]
MKKEEKINYDKYLSTPDGHFNVNAQSLYFLFSGSNKPKTNKNFSVFIKALHDIYFFIQNNSNKPFACLEKIKQISILYKFNEVEQLFFIDRILGILHHYPETDKISMVYIQILDYRFDLNPDLFINEIMKETDNFEFKFEEIEVKLLSIKEPSEKHKYLMNLLFDIYSKSTGFDEITNDYYNSIGLIEWIKAELARSEYEMKCNKSEPQPPKEKPGLTINQIALKYVYESISITNDNCNEIAKDFGLKGQRLLNQYNYYSSPINRKEPPFNYTQKIFKNKIKLFKSVIEILPEACKQKASDELKILEYHYNNEFK